MSLLGVILVCGATACAGAAVSIMLKKRSAAQAVSKVQDYVHLDQEGRFLAACLCTAVCKDCCNRCSAEVEGLWACSQQAPRGYAHPGNAELAQGLSKLNLDPDYGLVGRLEDVAALGEERI